MLCTSGSGYTYYVEEAGGKPLYIHRLNAYAEGLIDSPFYDGRTHIHHEASKWENSRDKLSAVECDAHCDHHCNGSTLRV